MDDNPPLIRLVIGHNPPTVLVDDNGTLVDITRAVKLVQATVTADSSVVRLEANAEVDWDFPAERVVVISPRAGHVTTDEIRDAMWSDGYAGRAQGDTPEDRVMVLLKERGLIAPSSGDASPSDRVPQADLPR